MKTIYLTSHGVYLTVWASVQEKIYQKNGEVLEVMVNFLSELVLN